MQAAGAAPGVHKYEVCHRFQKRRAARQVFPLGIEAGTCRLSIAGIENRPVDNPRCEATCRPRGRHLACPNVNCATDSKMDVLPAMSFDLESRGAPPTYLLPVLSTGQWCRNEKLLLS
jgi:hypothetical protein